MSLDAGLHIVLRRCRYTKKGVLRKPLRFPIAPVDEFGWDAAYAWTDYDTISAGQFSRRAGRQLRTLQVTTLAIDWSAPWSVIQSGEQEIDEDFYDAAGGPWEMAKRLDTLVMRGTPMLLIVRNEILYSKPDVQMIVTLRSANLRERAGEPDARYFDLGFTEYRVPKISRKNYGERHELPAQVVITKKGVAIEVERDDKRLPKKQRHRIGTDKSPATLRKLAKHYYGTPKEWKRIAKRNNIAKHISGDDSLEKLYDRRKRKGQPVRLNIPNRVRWVSQGGGIGPRWD